MGFLDYQAYSIWRGPDSWKKTTQPKKNWAIQPEKKNMFLLLKERYDQSTMIILWYYQKSKIKSGSQFVTRPNNRNNMQQS